MKRTLPGMHHVPPSLLNIILEIMRDSKTDKYKRRNDQNSGLERRGAVHETWNVLFLETVSRLSLHGN
jgi:hypothetical protein